MTMQKNRTILMTFFLTALSLSQHNFHRYFGLNELILRQGDPVLQLKIYSPNETSIDLDKLTVSFWTRLLTQDSSPSLPFFFLMFQDNITREKKKIFFNQDSQVAEITQGSFASDDQFTFPKTQNYKDWSFVFFTVDRINNGLDFLFFQDSETTQNFQIYTPVSTTSFILLRFCHDKYTQTLTCSV